MVDVTSNDEVSAIKHFNRGGAATAFSPQM
jgi:hypothetical protein